MWTTNEYAGKLPDVYRKDTDSNNYKLLSIESSSMDDLQSDINGCLQCLDINTATGKTLDLYGAIYGQKRGTLTDEQYRFMILNTVAKNFSRGSYSSVKEQLAIVFGCDKSDFEIGEIEGQCKVTLTKLPLEIFLRAGLTTEQLTRIIKNLIPVAVAIEPFEMQGTFEFAESANEYDENAGFGNEEQTIGGYLGAMSSDNIVFH